MGRPSIATRARDLHALRMMLVREWRSLALACAIIAVHLAGAAHRAFERHVLCADHGQWTHAEACEQQAAANLELADAVSCVAPHQTDLASASCADDTAQHDTAQHGTAQYDTAQDSTSHAVSCPAQLDASRGRPAGEHHHCLLVSMARVDGLAPLERCLPAAPALERVAPFIRLAESAHRSVSILHLAPKQSPPAA